MKKTLLVTLAILYCVLNGNPVALARSPQQKQIHANSDLFIGIASGNLPIIKQSLDQGANPNCRDTYGNTPLDWAVERTDVAVVKILLAHGAKPTAVQYHGLTPLIDAVNQPYRNAAQTRKILSIVQLLLSHGAEVNVQDNRGMTALIDAAYWGQSPVVQCLLQNGANTSLKNERGNTALKMAQGSLKLEPNQVKRQQLEVVVRLLKQAESEQHP